MSSSDFFKSQRDIAKEELTTHPNGLRWMTLSSESQLEEILKDSNQTTQVVFKHSTKCPISKGRKEHLEKEFSIPENEATVYYLDVITNRNVSLAIADAWGVEHQSPQLLIVQNGKVTYATSHEDITTAVVEEWVAKK